MNESRQLLKREAKERFKAQYGPCVWVQVVMFAITLVISWLPGQLADPEVMTRAILTNTGINTGQYFAYMVVTLLTGALLGAISIEVGYFYLRVFRGEKMTVRDFFAGLIVDVGKKAGAYLWMMLFLVLWGMAPVIPMVIILLSSPFGSQGIILLLLLALVVLMIIKGLSYGLMTYFIRDCPGVSVGKALRLSITLMKGNKGQLFVLGLSFLGWMLLMSAVLILPNILGIRGVIPSIAYGVLNALYVGPYIAITLAGFYHNLKQKGLKINVISKADLRGPE